MKNKLRLIRTLPMQTVAPLALTVVAAGFAENGHGDMLSANDAGVMRVTDLFPEGYVTDGSISYQRTIQDALDKAKEAPTTVIFPPMTYLLDDETGLSVYSNTTLWMYGAVFRFDEKAKKDGQAFLGEHVTDVRFLGGSVIGRGDDWLESVNIAGIRITGRSQRIHVKDMSFRNLSSNAVGIFGADGDGMISHVQVVNVISENCCNIYRDYLEPNAGPAEGSDRRDQGCVAFYYVESFLVTGCIFAQSRSDGTHFYKCRNGQFVNNQVVGSQMGGYFLEGCENVIAGGNLISRNGSRGVTIERDSRFCTLQNNIIEFSGREGLWAPDVMGCIVAHNIFRENGRKDDADRDSEIRLENTDQWPTETKDIRIEGNIFYTSAHQNSVIHVTAGVSDVVIRDNSYHGQVVRFYIDPAVTDTDRVVIGDKMQ